MVDKVASMSLDLDNQWSYMKTHGDPGWDKYPSYLDVVVPRVLGFLAQRRLTITFFVVGKDASLDKNQEAIQAIAQAGHEIGNHSFDHDQWLHLYTEDQTVAQIEQAEEHIERVTGQRTLGFRGPGYSCSSTTLRILAERGYSYDASTLPTFIGPLARAYYFMSAKLTTSEKHERSLLFGTIRDGMRPLKPYRWHLEMKNEIGGTLLEIPVTTTPIFRLPFHISYILYLSQYSEQLALAYFRGALALCSLANVQPSLLLHPLDFVGADDISALSFFPAMQMPSSRKLEIVGHVVDAFCDTFSVVTMHQHAQRLTASKNLAMIAPMFGDGRKAVKPVLSA